MFPSSQQRLVQCFIYLIPVTRLRLAKCNVLGQHSSFLLNFYFHSIASATFKVHVWPETRFEHTNHYTVFTFALIWLLMR